MAVSDLGDPRITSESSTRGWQLGRNASLFKLSACRGTTTASDDQVGHVGGIIGSCLALASSTHDNADTASDRFVPKHLGRASLMI